MGWRRESALDVYTGSFGLILFLSPWLFVHANEVARIDVWASGAANTAISIAAILAFSDWEEWFSLLLGLWSMVSPWALGFMHTRAMHVSIGLGAMVRPLNCSSCTMSHNSVRDSVIASTPPASRNFERGIERFAGLGVGAVVPILLAGRRLS
jgi:SPW repeat